jgi:hypothetical protein
MRKLVYDFLNDNSLLEGVLGDNKIFERGSIIDTRPADPPFIIYTITTTTRSIRPQSRLEIWVYDERGDYNRIDSILRLLRDQLDDFTERVRVRGDGSTARWVAADWQGDSADLNDDIFRANVRSGTWVLIGEGQ